MNVTGYPTLFYYRNSDDPTLRTEEMFQPIKYEGKLEFKHFLKLQFLLGFRFFYQLFI